MQEIEEALKIDSAPAMIEHARQALSSRKKFVNVRRLMRMAAEIVRVEHEAEASAKRYAEDLAERQIKFSEAFDAYAKGENLPAVPAEAGDPDGWLR